VDVEGGMEEFRMITLDENGYDEAGQSQLSWQRWSYIMTYLMMRRPVSMRIFASWLMTVKQRQPAAWPLYYILRCSY
jgi:hypothetical protein